MSVVSLIDAARFAKDNEREERHKMSRCTGLFFVWSIFGCSVGNTTVGRISIFALD